MSTLSQQLALSERKQAILLISQELDNMQGITDSFVDKHTYFKRWNGVLIDYPSDNYNQVMSELKPLVEEGAEVQQYLYYLVMISSQHRTGLTPGLRSALSKFAVVGKELDAILTNFTRLKEDEDRLHPPPAAVETPASCTATSEQTIRFACHQCQQPIEVNSSACGQSFHCPHCSCKLTVPSSS